MASRKVKFDFKPSDYVDGVRFKSESQKKSVMADISDFVVESILKFVGKSKSPVTGSVFKGLSKDYAKKKVAEGGVAKANLELHGNLLDSVKVIKKSDNVLRLTVDDSEMGKADGHNNFSGESKLPRRPFIPNADRGEDFAKPIRDGIEKIILRAIKED